MKICLACQKVLIGRQNKYCSIKCKSSITNKSFQKYSDQQRRGFERKLEIFKSRGGGCEICGYCKNLAAIEFHHKEKTKKSFIVDLRALGNYKKEKIHAELEKCMMICSNCHRTHHNPFFNIP